MSNKENNVVPNRDDLHQKLDHLIKDFARQAHEKLDRAIVSGNLPDDWLNGNATFLPQLAAIDSLCRDRPFAPRSPTIKANFENIHLTI